MFRDKAVVVTWAGGIIGALAGIMNGNDSQTMWSIILAIIGTEFITQYKLGKLESMAQTVSNMLKTFEEKIKKLEEKINKIIYKVM